jgi:UDP-glucose 4-epimerase
MMKILLVGGLGFIGKRFIRKFSDTHNIVVYAQHNDTARKEILHNKNVIYEEGRVEDEKVISVITEHKPDVVVHLAALTGVSKCEADPQQSFKINVYGTFNVVKGCSRSRSKLIFISSREVYGETRDGKSKETDRLTPNNLYGLTKMLGEILIEQESRKNNLEYTILRLTNVYGPEGDHYGAQVIIRNAIEKGQVNIMGGGQKLNYVYVDDVVNLINQILDNKKASREIFNVGSEDTLSIEEFIAKVISLAPQKISIKKYPMRESETINFVPDLSKTRTYLGFNTTTSLDEGLKKTIHWYSGNS